MILYLSQLLGENPGFLPARIYLFLQNLSSPLEYLYQARFTHITYIVALVLYDDALGANVDLVVFAEELGALVWVLKTILLGRKLLLLKFLFFLLSADMALTVKIVKYGEVLDQLFDIRTEIAPASGTSQYIARSEVHEAVLAEGMSTGEYARDLLFVVVLVEANRTGHFHPVIIIPR